MRVPLTPLAPPSPSFLARPNVEHNGTQHLYYYYYYYIRYPPSGRCPMNRPVHVHYIISYAIFRLAREPTKDNRLCTKYRRACVSPTVDCVLAFRRTDSRRCFRDGIGLYTRLNLAKTTATSVLSTDNSFVLSKLCADCGCATKHKHQTLLSHVKMRRFYFQKCFHCPLAVAND